MLRCWSNERLRLAVAGSLWAVMSLALAGPLDRGPMPQRHNPSLQNSLRIPGVLGQYESAALEILQQAGLAVSVRYLRQPRAEWTGKEGQVLAQIPLPGGVAMLGTTVTISVYLPPGSEGSGQQSAPGEFVPNDEGASEEADAPVWSPPEAGDESGYGPETDTEWTGGEDDGLLDTQPSAEAPYE